MRDSIRGFWWYRSRNSWVL